MTGRVHLTPEAERQLNEVDDWISKAATPQIAQRFVTTVLDHIDGILAFPFAGRPRDDIRPGLRTTTFKRRTVIAYVVDEDSDGRVITVLGVFHGGQDWTRALSSDQDGAP